MNICIISRELYPFQKAGIAVYVYNLSLKLAQHGHKIFIITDNHTDLYNVSFHKNIKIVPVLLGDPLELRFFSTFNQYYSYNVYKTLKKLLSEAEIDLIEISDYFGEGFFILNHKKKIGEFAQIPIVLKLHTPTYECNVANEISVPENEITLQEDYCIRNADYLYAISFAMKKKIEERLQGLAPIDVVYNLTGVNQIKEIAVSENALPSQESNIRKRVLLAGRLEKRKGTDIFIQAALKVLKVFTNVEFVIVGKDSIDVNTNRSFKDILLESIPDDQKQYFTFLEPVTREELIHLYAEAYICVFPSRWEGFGNVCIEAMSAGSPVIVSDAGGMVEIIDHGQAGLYFESENSDSLANKLIDVLENKDFRELLKDKAIERSKQFNDEILYEKQLDFYNKILNEYHEKLRGNNNFIITESNEIDLLKNWLKSFESYKGLSEELKRVMGEWEQLSASNEMLRKELKRVMEEWEQLSASNEMLKEEVKRVTKEWEKATEQNKKNADENREMHDKLIEMGQLVQKLGQELEQLKANINDRKWLLKQIFLLKR